MQDGFETYHVMNPYDDGIGMDEFVDWLVEAGHKPVTLADDQGTARAGGVTRRLLPVRRRP